MIELTIYFPKSRLNALLDVMDKGPEFMRPRYFGLLDVVDDKANRVDNESRFRAFLEPRMNGSFALFADKISYDFMLAGSGPATMFSFGSYPPGPTPDAIGHFFRLLAPIEPPFAVACETDEFEHRNRVVHSVPEVTAESWFGRDIQICVPGLYWSTMISSELLRAHEIKLPQICEHALSVESIGNLNLLKFFEAAADWKSHADRLDDVCESIPGIFSARPVYASVQCARTMRELNEILDEWHKSERRAERKFFA